MKTKFLTLFVALLATTAMWAQNNVITYTASTKLIETQDFYSDGLHTNAFNVSISSHTFSNGTGTITFVDEVTNIGSNAFKRCSGLTSVIIPNSVIVLGYNAFLFCSDLTSITIPNSVTTIYTRVFEGCTGLVSATIGNSVTEIQSWAFSGCSSLTSVTIGNSVTKIGKWVFGGCINLTSITIPNSVTEINEGTFSGCSSLTSIQFMSVTPPTFGSNVFEDVPLSANISIPCGAALTYKKVSALSQYTNYSTFGDFPYTLTVTSSDNDLGMVEITNSPNCITNQATIKATSLKSGYHFAQWSDGNKQNPRTLTLMQNFDLIAQFERNKCGDNLFWDFDTITNTLTITGTGAMTNYTSTTVPWIKWQNQIETVILPSEITSIGNFAFCDCANLTSITIPVSIISIGQSAFSNCKNLTSITIPNSVASIGQSAFSSCSGLTTVGCIGSGSSIEFGWTTTIPQNAFSNCESLTLVVIPMNITSVGAGAFSGCAKLDTAYIENYFTAYEYNSFPSTTKIKVLTSVTAEQTSKNLCSAIVHMTISDALKNYYDEIGIRSGNINYIPNEKGDIYLRFSTPLESGWYHSCDIYAKKNAERITKGEVRIYTPTPSLSCSSSSTQTTITLSNIYASTDTSVHSLSKGIYYNYKRYEADENNKVVITGIVPNTKCTLQIYGCYNGNYYYGDSKYVTTKSIAPVLTVTESPTSVYAKGSYTHGDATILGTSVVCTTTGSSVAGDEGLMTGLKPNKSYSFTYSVDTKEGGTYTATKTITTPALTLTTLTPKVVSAGNVVVAASTNISDLETNVGFEWRKYNAPPELPSSRAQAILYSGQMEGILHNLSLEYWKVRAYYEAADGTCYYGEWATFDPSQPAYFEPTVHTYALVTDPTVNKVQMRGYVMTGTDDVTEQGFEYWFKGSKAPRRVASATPDSIYRVQASGQVMTAVLEDLAYSTTYTCRAYAIAGGKTYYGEEVQFLTPEDPRPIYTLSVIAGENGSVNTDVSGQYREGETVTLTATPMAGYRFLQWSDENTDNPRQLTIMANTELMAIFEVADGLLDVFMSDDAQQTTKFMYNNHLYILRDGNLFTATGAKVK